MKIQNTVLLITAVIFTIVLTEMASADIPNDYCYDQDMEGFICFETEKMCETERQIDLLAESKCYIATE